MASASGRWARATAGRAGAGYGRLESSRPVWARPGRGSFGGRRSLLARAAARGSPARRLDWVLIGAVLGLTVLSTLLIWSATRPQLLQAGGDPQAFLKKQVLNVVIGLVLLGVVSMLDYRMLRAYAPIGYLLACLGMLAVLTPLGATINGARSWIVIGGGYEVEPSEFAKVTLVLVLALVLGELREGDRAPRGRDLVLAIAVSLPALGLVLLQPDLSVAIVMAVVIFGMVVVSGTRLRWIAALLVLTVATALVVMAAAPAQGSTRSQRITAFVHPTANPNGSGYDASQALITIGSGGMFGQGLFHGGQTTGHFVPEQQTDFIFTVAGEELGFVGAIVIIALLGVILVAGAADRSARGQPVRHPDRRRRGLLVRRADVHQHRDDRRDHAGKRPAVALRLLRRNGHVRQHDRHRPAPGRPPAPHDLQLTPRDSSG